VGAGVGRAGLFPSDVSVDFSARELTATTDGVPV
jgi:hypothetical protein